MTSMSHRLVVVACTLLASLILPACSRSTVMAPTAERGLLLRTLDVPDPVGGTRQARYAVLIPRDLDLSTPQPALLFLHGRGECGTDGSRQAVVGLGSAALLEPAQYPFIMIFPQKPTGELEWGDFEPMVLAILDQAMRDWPIDPDRVVLTGLSQGGHGTWVIAARNPDRFAAIAPVCGYGPVRWGTKSDPVAERESLARGVAHLPIWAFHGLRDDVVLPIETTSMIDAVRAAQSSGTTRPPAPIMTLFPDANHNAWDPAYRGEHATDQGPTRLVTWLLAQRRAQRPQPRAGGR